MAAQSGPFTFEAYEGDKPYLFVSYAHADDDARADIQKLSDLGYRIWYDVKLEDSDEWQAKITEAIDGCTLFLVFLSERAIKSKWVRREAARADDSEVIRKDGVERAIPITPVFFQKDKIRTNNLVIDDLWNRQGIERYRFTADLNGYYRELIAQLPPETRTSDVNRDAEILGLGQLPDMREIVEGKLFLSQDEQTRRRNLRVQELVDVVSKTGKAVYSMETVFQLTSGDTDAVAKLGRTVLPGAPSKDKPSHLLAHPLDIGSAYIAPLRLITGLVTRLQENWPPLVASYSELFRRDQMNSLQDFHYFMEYCWLAWGPSVPTTSLLEDPSTNFTVVQVAYGDEANSLPMIVRKDKARQVRAAFEKLHDQQGGQESFELRVKRGWPVRLGNVLVVKPEVDPFFAGLCEHELLRNMLKKAEANEPDKVALYLPSGDEGYAPGVVEPNLDTTGAFYSTAYVWLMIESTAKPAETLEPGRVIPFFEHANLATSKGLKFLQHCLARKAIYHVLGCEEDPDPDYRNEGVYRFATALFPEEMVKILDQEIQRLAPHEQEVVGRRLTIPDPKRWRSPVEVVRFADKLEDKIKTVLNDILKKGTNGHGEVLAAVSTSASRGLAA